ncbi:MAG: TonB-dependent receptor [Xanthomonadales bacterium]|nr:TonB-dependent receptor [Gammaproteobacteria bacterium]MBT8054435.1 TonB-dependent receptor [Gammaproteobacteria bacterium]NND58449.1 TonB-dependent receptor [Xanthomonadales bacterium]NNK50130.1 TonB-dependent receptor [Xanthomonadales bacterium]
MKKRTFSRTPLSVSIAVALGAFLIQPVYGQNTADEVDERANEEEPMMEEVFVTGVRKSLIDSMDRKRDASGLVDAITAEDIGKFPDTNLAEALARIPGVSIDRINGEGSAITVRGLGPEFNLVTLNGRQMPTAGSRSFNFADIATEGISAIEVYKTPRVNLPSGGIGATVNVLTPRPLNSPGFRAVATAKAHYESSAGDSDRLDKWTPEVSGLLSATFADDTFGVLVSASYSDRQNREEEAHVASWIPNRPLLNPNAVIENNNQRADGYNWYPQDAGYGWADIERKRTNAQVVLQWEPTDNFKATLDYTYSTVDFKKNANGFGIWFLATGSVVGGTVNERGTWTSVTEAGGDYATGISRDHTQKTNDSIGLNLEWVATDNLAFTLDAHTSTSKNVGDGLGDRPGSSANVIIGNSFDGAWCASEGQPYNPDCATANITTKTATYGPGGVPIFDIGFVGQGPNAGIPQDELFARDIGSLFGQAFDTDQKNDIDQIQLGGSWQSDGDALQEINFGVSYLKNKFRQQDAYSGQLPAGFWLTSATWWPDDTWTREEFGGLLGDFNNTGNFPVDWYWTAPFDTVVDGYETVGANDPNLATCCYWPSWPADFQGDGRGYFWSGPFTGDSRVTEKTTSLYGELVFASEFLGMPVNMVTGLRWEKTEVNSQGIERPATALFWVGGNEWRYEFAEDDTLSDGGGKNDYFLPSLNFDMSFTDNLVGRASYSRSIARPPIGALSSSRTFNGNPLVTNRSVSVGNPELKPYVSDNFDVSLEWYYAEGSYASVAYYHKLVDNFLVGTTIQDSVDGLQDPYIGDLANQARAELTAEGTLVSDANLFQRMNEILGNNPPQEIGPMPGDPLAIFSISTTTNAEEGKLNGWEFQVQHLFGDSGFGIVANATLVGGDVNADRDVVNRTFALPGLSDSANFTVFYENEVISTRLAYNWRDEFLSGFDQYDSPVFTEAYDQLDANFTWFPAEDWSVFVEAINLTKSTQRIYVRYPEQLIRANQYGSRYSIGVSYRF